jgi:hypothetical protein
MQGRARNVQARRAAACAFAEIDFTSGKFLPLMKSVSEEYCLSRGLPQGRGPVATAADTPGCRGWEPRAVGAPRADSEVSLRPVVRIWFG